MHFTQVASEMLYRAKLSKYKVCINRRRKENTNIRIWESYIGGHSKETEIQKRYWDSEENWARFTKQQLIYVWILGAQS